MTDSKGSVSLSAKQKQNFLHGALILMSATVIVKIIGYFFKVPLKGIIGVSGFGYFNAAYGLFNTLYALSVAGMPVAVARMVAQNMQQGRFRDVRKIKRLSTIAFLCAGLLGSLLMLAGAGPYVRLAQNPNAFLSVFVMSPAIFFVCASSSYRGYYEGLRNMYPTAWSQVLEALVKLVCGLLFACAAIRMGMEEYEGSGTVFGALVSTPEQARLAVLPYGAAGAILGIVVSTAAGSLFLWAYNRRRGDGISAQMLEQAVPAATGKEILKQLWTIAVPICLGALALNITTLIDVSSLTNRLSTALANGEEALLSMYDGILPADMPREEIPNYLFGAYNMSVTLFNLIPALTTTFGVSALPSVTAAWTSQNRRMLQKNIESVWRVTSMIAFPAGFGICALAEPILTLVYQADPASIPIAAPILRVLGIAAIFVALSSPTNSMLQAIGRVKVPVRLMLIGGFLKLAVNFSLVPIPSVNIQGAPFGTLLCYMTIICISVPTLCRAAGVRLRFGKVFLKPLFAGALCGITAWAGYGLLSRVAGNTISTSFSILAAGIVYVVVLFLTHGVEKYDILMLPKGEKIAKLLEKYGLIE
ncbi:MAG TPA: polysaccharide biosynthesis protein [Ruminococcaceae bacterium]|nr:polysaccharide biosynthesis protein [Oscillospiraceae bacterium]HAO69198.1 polysaccharide biosynthesis protein [Oscillospiraceae bacterium]HCB65602.1 polysaccharide biosynthesis protein [Oscillospiraceae bacterium]